MPERGKPFEAFYWRWGFEFMTKCSILIRCFGRLLNPVLTCLWPANTVVKIWIARTFSVVHWQMVAYVAFSMEFIESLWWISDTSWEFDKFTKTTHFWSELFIFHVADLKTSMILNLWREWPTTGHQKPDSNQMSWKNIKMDIQSRA